MSVKIKRSDSASPLLPNSAAPEAKGSRPAGPRHPSICSRSLFSKAPKNSSTSMAPRDTTPLLSAEQRAARSDAPVQNARPGSMKPASSLLSRAQKAVSSGAKVVSSGMQQAGKAMSHAYQALNEPNYTRLHSNYSQEEMAAAAYYGVEPSSTPAVQPEPRSQRFDSAHTVPSVPVRVRPMTTEEAAAEDKRADYHNERPVHHVEEVDQAALARAQQQAAQAPRRQDSERVLMRPMNDAERAQEDARAEQHHEYPHYHDVVDHEAMAARRSQGNPSPRSQAAPTITRPRPDFDAMAARLDALGQAAKARKNQGQAPQRPPEARPEVRLSENVRPPVNGQAGRPQGTGPAPGRPAQTLATSRPAVHHAPPEPAKPARQPLAPLGTHTGNVPQPTVRLSPATGGKENTGPNVGRTSQHAAARKNMQAFAESFKRGDMNRNFSPKQLVVAMQGLAQGTRFEAAVARQINTNPKWGEQMQGNWTALRKAVEASQASDPHAPSLEQIVGSPQLRTKLVRFLATGEGMQRLLPPKPQTPQAPLTAQVKVLDQKIAESQQKGDEIRTRMFHAPTGPERIAATRESYAHKAQHDRLTAARDQLLSARNDMAAGPVIGRLKDLDGKIAALEQRAGELNKVINQSPSGQQRAAAAKEKNTLRPAWEALTAERADLRAQLEGLRPEFQQARELAKGLKELAEVRGAKDGSYAIGGRYPLHDRDTIETNFERQKESRHLLGKEPQLQAAQQQLRDLLQSGKLKGMPPKDAGELGKLARLDLGAQFDRLNELQDVVALTRANLRAMGAGGLYEGIKTTPDERKADRDDELRSHQDALDNGYL